MTSVTQSQHELQFPALRLEENWASCRKKPGHPTGGNGKLQLITFILLCKMETGVSMPYAKPEDFSSIPQIFRTLSKINGH